MGWLELLIVCCIPGSIKLNREYGKTNIEVVPISFMVIEFVTTKIKDLLSSPSRPESESKTAEAKAA
jgi:hypothetical protein